MFIDKISKRISSSIRNKGIISIMIPLILMVLFASIYYPTKQKEVSLEYAETQVKTLGEMLAFSVGAGLNDSNFDLVQTAFDWIKKDKNVVYTAIIDETNTVLIEHNPNNMKVDPLSISKFEFDKISNSYKNLVAVEYKGKNFGNIAMLYSMEHISEEIEASTFTAILISILMLLFGIAVVVFIFNRITKGIVNLRDAAKQASEGNLDHQLEVKSADEIGDLIKAFNKMMSNISIANEELENEKHSVEKKVEHAVQESEKQKRYLAENIDKILLEMNKFAEGDLTVNLEVENKNDVIGKLFTGFNLVVKNINQMIVNVSESVLATSKAGNEISSSTEEMAAGSQEQSAQTTEVASAVEEMANTILQTTKNASSAAEFSKKAGESALNGGNVVKQTVEGMNRIAEVVGNASVIMKELGKSSNQIGEIIQVIDDIADQTNLLALNAAIEAARAGEQGRGFAVVADEVRKLAERTTKATKEIAAMIKQIQKDTGNAVNSIESGTKEVENGKELANKAIIALDEIIGSTNQTIDVVNQVAAASEEQSSAAEQISRSIESISNVTNESTSGIQQIAKASEDLNYLTTNLQTLVSKFKTNDKIKRLN